MKKYISVTELIKEFESLAKKQGFIMGNNATQQDLLIQILGVISVVAMRNEAEIENINKRLVDTEEVILRTNKEASAMVEPFRSQLGLLVEWIVGKTSTAYDVDVVINQITEMANVNGNAYLDCADVIDIVKEGGINEK